MRVLVACGHQPDRGIMKRPTAITVFGVLNIGFAAFGLIGILFAAAVFSMARNSGNPMLDIMRNNPSYAAWIKITIPLGVLSSLALLASGIGVLMMKNWARKLAIAYAIFSLVFGLVGQVVNFVYLAKPMMEQAGRSRGPESVGAIGGAIGSVIGGCFGMVYPIVLLIFMLRPKLVATFNPAPVAPGLPPFE